MDSIRAEVEDLRRRRKDYGSGVVDVASFDSHVSVIIKKTKHKAVSATFHFCEMYPTKPAMVELNSKFLSSRCLDAMTELCEEECGKLVGKPHITFVVALLEKYLDTNPLCVCADELFEIKKKLDGNGSWACRPNSSKGTLTVRKGKYSASFSLAVPEEYPARCVEKRPMHSGSQGAWKTPVPTPERRHKKMQYGENAPCIRDRKAPGKPQSRLP